jgi:hypothetical protein
MSFSARLAAMLALLVACTALVGLAAVVTVNDLHRQEGLSPGAHRTID